MHSEPVLSVVNRDGTVDLRPGGSWTVAHASVLESLYVSVEPELRRMERVRIDMTSVGEIDTLGAWLLEKILRHVPQVSQPVDVVGISDRYAGLIAEVNRVNRRKTAVEDPENQIIVRLEQLGRYAAGMKEEIAIFLRMLGALGAALLGVLRQPRSLRLTSLAYQIYRVGWQAIPIVLLITFLIGAIIAQQGIFHFRKFGACSSSDNLRPLRHFEKGGSGSSRVKV